MWISRKRLKMLEKKIADLEVQVQDQQKSIILLDSCKARPLSDVIQDVLGEEKDFQPLIFRANLNRRILFEQSVEPKD